MIRNIFTLLFSIFIVNAGISQQLLFEDFNSTGGMLPAGWQSIDNDLPAQNPNLPGPQWDMWHVDTSSINGVDVVIAASSWLDVNTVPADDWLITPAVTGLTASTTLNWKAGSVSPNYLEPYEVYVSTGSTIADFLATTPVFTTTGAQAGGYFPQTVSLATYAGQTVYIAYRLTGQDLLALELDDIEVTNTAPPPPPPAPVNDDCANSVDVNSSLGLGVGVPGSSGPYDNTGATAHPTDPTTGYTCFFDLDAGGTQAPLIDNSMWYTFVGDGKSYEITTTDCGGGMAGSGLIISGIGDGPLSGGQPKFVELYAAGPIADLGVYGLESVNNGAGIGLPEYTFPAGVSVAQGTYIYITGNAAAFTSFFGFNADYIDAPSTSINGDDAVALYENGVVVDVAGDPNMDGSGTPWEYLDGFMYRVTGKSASATFNVGDWTYSGINVFDGQTTNSTSPTPFPNGTFTGGAFTYITNGDTQLALYSGACGTLTPVDCNEDIANPPAGQFPGGFVIPTTAGVTYHLMVDGWSDLSAGSVSEGQYCVQFTEQAVVVTPPCDAGTLVSSAPVSVCPGASTTVAVTTDTIPSGGGYGWIFSDSQGGTGGLAGGLFLTGAPTSYAFDDDLNGVLSANSLPSLDGVWVVYGATYTDPNNAGSSICSITTDSLVVTFNPGVAASIVSSTDITCAGDADGSADLTTTCGLAPLTYSWSNGATTEDLSGVSGGTYTCVVTDANGSTSSVSVTIAEPAALGYIIDFQQTTPNLTLDCFGDQDGAIVITTTGGTMPYTFIWSNGAVTEDLTGLSQGNYAGTITDANGCQITSPPIPINEPPALAGTATVTDDSGSAGIGAIDFTPAGGTSPYTFLWSNGAVTEDLNGLSAGSYTVDMTDANGCMMTFGPYTVMNTSSSTVVIEGLNDLSVQPNPTYGNVMINLSLDTQMEVKLELYSVTGRLVQSFESEMVTSRQYDLNLSNNSAGIYFAKFLINDKVITKRISLLK